MSELPARALAPAKINLGLFLGPAREDCRHELVTVMQSISLADELTLEWTPVGATRDEIVCPEVPGSPAENLATAALEGLRASVRTTVDAMRTLADASAEELHARALAHPQQAVVDEDAGQPIADRAQEQRRRP